MNMRKIMAVGTAGVLLGLTASGSAQSAVSFFTCVGGASGMTLQLNPYASGGVQRGCAPKMMTISLRQKNTPPNTGTVKYAYTKVRIRAADPAWSEPDNTAWPGGQKIKFTGDQSDAEIAYLKLSNNDIIYGICVRADSVLGLRFVVNRQYIYGFSKPHSSAPSNFVDENKVDLTSDPDFSQVIAHMNSQIPSPGIPIEGGLSECYMDSGVRAIDRHNRLFPDPKTQPQLNPANFATTKDNLLAVAVLAVIYHKNIEDFNGGQPFNVTNQMARMIQAGKVDNWNVFFGSDGVNFPLLNYHREPLSGTGITWLQLAMRGLELNKNGTTVAGPICGTDGVNYHTSGIPDLTCVVKPTDTCPGNKPGGGAVNNAVDNNPGSISYTFLQKFTPVTAPALQNIRVAKFNGYAPYDFVAQGGNSLPGINGVTDVNVNTNPLPQDHYFKPVIDGKYPLWTYNHCFDATNGTSNNLADYVANFKLIDNAPLVREVGLIPIDDMNSMAYARTMSTSGPNAYRGPGLGRCGFVSPVTGETVRDGMSMMLNDWETTQGDGKKLPGESFVEMRP